MRLDQRTIEIGLAATAFAAGLILALSTLQRGVWLDEFWTLMATDPAQSPTMFWQTMAKDVHPILHYGLIYVARTLGGVEDVVGLRAFNLLGLPLAVGAAWYALRCSALTVRQACIIAAVAASSAMFLDTLAEIRTYFPLFCASIAVTLVWRLLMIRLQRGEPAGAGGLAMWALCLVVFVNLHYFATFFGGVLTLGLIGTARDRRAISIAAVSAAAALPALALLAAQSVNMDTTIVAWILTGRIDGAYVLADNVWAAVGENIIALGCAVVAMLFLIGDRKDWRPYRQDLILVGLLAAYAAALVVANAFRPVIIDRYLIAVGGATAVVVAVLATHPRLPAWSVSAICVFAMLVQFRSWHDDRLMSPGWSESARFVADQVAACPGAKVFLHPDLAGADLPAYRASRRVGHLYYAQRLGFAVEDTGAGQDIAPDAACPNVLWVEDMTTPPALGAQDALKIVGLRSDGPAELYRIGKASIVILN